MSNEFVDIEGELISPFETEKAYHFYDGSTRCWLPKSQCEWDDESKEMTLPLWLAEEKGLV